MCLKKEENSSLSNFHNKYFGGYKGYINKGEFIILIIIGVIIVALPLLLTNSYLSIVSFKETGPIGDTIGGITAPFLSLFGSILVYLALKAQIVANDKINDQFLKQEKKEYRQNFENTFFNLLSMHHQIITDIDFETKKIYHFHNDLKEFIKTNTLIKDEYRDGIITNEHLKSRDVFKFSFEVLDYLLYIDKMIFEEDDYLKEKSKEKDITRFNELFKKTHKLKYNQVEITSKFTDIYFTIYSDINADLGHYFRNVYRIFKTIDNSIFHENKVEDFKIKYQYSSIIRAQLSDFEIYWIFLNCLTENGCEKFKPLLEKYSILKVVPIRQSDTIFFTFKDLYNERAYNSCKNDDEILKLLEIDFFKDGQYSIELLKNE
ncbi:putative phage abortive infection protein [Flavobacterium sp. LHD-80]|uniref:putative phage abortive infection protein n=1 Tax=Flavobacterium sp. LHD-80 TaxID=3071411 RepID=UPI0027E072C4|nr:putative phage abortive infection protein [Flavobacterium sp. LHD-80]MDQ6471400.1 putative phage abortive infection protein [Flavobacterium sp. LHD-80]